MNTTDTTNAIQANTQASVTLRKCLRVAASAFFTGVFALVSTWMMMSGSSEANHARAATMPPVSVHASAGDTSVPAAHFGADTAVETQAPTF